MKGGACWLQDSHAHRYMPSALFLLYSPLPAGSVPFWRRMRYWRQHNQKQLNWLKRPPHLTLR